MVPGMSGRFTYKLTWPEIVKLSRLPLGLPARNTLPHRPDRRGDRARGPARVHLDALGAGALLVVEAAARALQRTRRVADRGELTIAANGDDCDRGSPPVAGGFVAPLSHGVVSELKI
jgi:hypothetical protein